MDLNAGRADQVEVGGGGYLYPSTKTSRLESLTPESPAWRGPESPAWPESPGILRGNSGEGICNLRHLRQPEGAGVSAPQRAGVSGDAGVSGATPGVLRGGHLQAVARE